MLAGKRILVVEDEAIVSLMVEDMLISLGATVVGPAGTLARGLTLAQTEPIDAAVLDVNLRDERADGIAAILRTRAIPYIFATGYGLEGVKDEAAAPVIDKPYTREKLSDALGRALLGR